MRRVVFTPVPPEEPEPKGRLVFTPPQTETRSIAELRVQKVPEDSPAQRGGPRRRWRAAKRRIAAMIADNSNTISVVVVFAATTALTLLLYVLIRPE